MGASIAKQSYPTFEDESMSLFAKHGFNQGSWAGGLRSVLRERRVLTDKQAVTRLWRPTWTHWIQFEPIGYTGPAFWFGKPAIIAREEVLYAGYYVERGYAVHENSEYVMDSGWHWRLLLTTLANTVQRRRMSELMENLPESRRCIWLLCGQEPSKRIAYQDATSLDEMQSVISACDSNDWIDLILGVSFTVDDCLALQEGVVDELRAPLIRALEIEALISSSLVTTDIEDD